MATIYFKTGTGEPFTRNAVTGEDGVAKGHCIKVDDAPDNIADWRMTYNFSTNSVDVYAKNADNSNKTDAEATQQQLDDEAKIVEQVKAAEAQKIADMAG